DPDRLYDPRRCHYGRRGGQSCAPWRQRDGVLVSQYRTQRKTPGTAGGSAAEHPPRRGAARFEYASRMGRSDRGRGPSPRPCAPIARGGGAGNLRGRVRSCRNRARRRILASAFFNSHKARLVELAAKYRLPTMYEHDDFVRNGGLIAYGPNIPDLF